MSSSAPRWRSRAAGRTRSAFSGRPLMRTKPICSAKPSFIDRHAGERSGPARHLTAVIEPRTLLQPELMFVAGGAAQIERVPMARSMWGHYHCCPRRRLLPGSAIGFHRRGRPRPALGGPAKSSCLGSSRCCPRGKDGPGTCFQPRLALAHGAKTVSSETDLGQERVTTYVAPAGTGRRGPGGTTPCKALSSK
jgi:hypothetical protein